MLDAHGKLAILELAVYIPTILLCVWNNIRLGFRRDAGWIYLSIFCLVKIAGAGTLLDYELGNNQSIVTTSAILNTVALSPLLSATLSFVNISQEHLALTKMFRLVHIIIIVGLGLSIGGGVDRAQTSQQSLDTGALYIRIATVLFFLAWIALSFAWITFMFYVHEVMGSKKLLLRSVGVALPFLLVRIIYSALNAINLDTSTSGGHTGNFNPVTGSWIIYLCLGLLMEFTVVGLYTITGIFVHSEAKKGERFSHSSDTEFLDVRRRAPVNPSYA